MDNSTPQQKPSQVRRSPSPDQRASLVEEWKRSGVSARQFAEKTGVDARKLYRWAEQLGLQRARRELPASAPRPSRRPATPPAAPTRFLSVAVAESKNVAAAAVVARGGIEIVWPSGPVVRVSGEVSASSISAVVRAMTEVTSC